jgi:hypothetical protein
VREAGLGRKKGSYKFEKRQKELKKQKKKREKMERRQNKGNGSDEEPQPSFDIDAFLGTPVDSESREDSEG